MNLKLQLNIFHLSSNTEKTLGLLKFIMENDYSVTRGEIFNIQGTLIFLKNI